MNDGNFTADSAAEAARRIQTELERQIHQFGDTVTDGVNNFFDNKKPLTPAENIRKSAKKRRGAGVALLSVGITFMVVFGLAAFGCFGAAGMVDTTEMLYGLSDAAASVLNVVGGISALITAGFGWMTGAGAVRMKACNQLNQLADAAESEDTANGISLKLLADYMGLKEDKLLKKLRKFINNGWLAVWIDEKNDSLYLTLDSYRAAQAQAKAEAAAAKAKQAAAESDSTHANLEAARSFANVLLKEQSIMLDKQAVEELEQMHKTTLSICNWLETHPESLPKARRLAEYYIPTTLKLLYTYNDVQGQNGKNAEAIRCDIAAILHTLNTAYENLYNSFLSDAALDVSSEIAALQGMLASDGLTGEGLI